MMDVKYIAVIISLVVLLVVIELIRREKMTFKYALSWLVASVLAIIVSVFDNLLFKAADLFGFTLASNFVFFTLLTVFVFMSLLITIFLCQQSRRNDNIAQKIAMLEFELKEFKKKHK